MSNKMNTPPTIRWQLLSTVSALALLGSACTAEAAGNDTDRPLIWLELGGQMESVSGQGEVFAPPFLAINAASPVLQSVTPLQAQRPSKFSFGEDGKISFKPKGSDWRFSAAIRYSRSSNTRHVQHQTTNVFYKYHYKSRPSVGLDTKADFSDTHASRSESHAILDFSVGKDVGLGMLGRDSSSTLNLGVRFAQFTSNASFDIRARPDLKLKYYAIPSAGQTFVLPYFNNYHATGRARRSFRGMGPSISWNGSTPFVGNVLDGELTFDWGANAALLFGKQKTHVKHQETAQSHSTLGFLFGASYTDLYNRATPVPDRTRSVTVPNVGGSVGLSWRVQDFKVSMGYRADFFFGAMDTGIDAAKKSNLTFNGPYASVSVGLGD